MKKVLRFDVDLVVVGMLHFDITVQGKGSTPRKMTENDGVSADLWCLPCGSPCWDDVSRPGCKASPTGGLRAAAGVPFVGGPKNCDHPIQK